jgi:hypothetical protein
MSRSLPVAAYYANLRDCTLRVNAMFGAVGHHRRFCESASNCDRRSCCPGRSWTNVCVPLLPSLSRQLCAANAVPVHYLVVVHNHS